MVSVECMVLVVSWQCVVSSMGDALCMVCIVLNVTQVEAKCCRMSTMVVIVVNITSMPILSPPLAPTITVMDEDNLGSDSVDPA